MGQKIVMKIPITRRAMLRGLAAAPLIAATGCSKRRLPATGEIVGASQHRGHAIRDGSTASVPQERRQALGIVIVGGGVAGLAAAWQLQRAGHDDFVLLELEDDVG